MNGAAAHRASPGDLLIIAAYGSYSEDEVASHRPRLVYVDEGNCMKGQRAAIPEQRLAAE